MPQYIVAYVFFQHSFILGVESGPCTPNPCSHGGTCSVIGDSFICDCMGTNYTGLTCNTAVIYLPEIPSLTQYERHSVVVSTDLDIPQSLKILFLKAGVKRPLISLQLQTIRKNDMDYLRFEMAGIHTITYGLVPKNVFEVRPSQLAIFVREESEHSHELNIYFTTMKVKVGQLKESCCVLQDELSLTCPDSTQEVALKAACQWKKDSNTYLAPGVIFAMGRSLSLPVSVAGYQYSQNGEGSLPPDISECTHCNSGEPICTQHAPSDDDCYCYNFTGSDTQDFQNTRALGLTYMEQIQILMPEWLRIWVNLNHSRFTSQFSVYDYLAPVLQINNNIEKQAGCSKIVTMTSGVYSVLRYDKTLSAEINGQQYTSTENSNSRNGNDPMCFAVNLCQGISSPVYMQLSQSIQNILITEYLHNFTTKGWIIQLNTITVYRPKPFTPSVQKFWNGMKMVVPSTIMVDTSINTNTEAVLWSEYLNMTVMFTGDAILQYQVRAPLFVNCLVLFSKCKVPVLLVL